MAMNIKKSRKVTTVILAALLIGCLSSAAWTFQEPKRTPTSEEGRRQALERLTKQLQENQPSAKPVPAAAAQQPPSPTQPAPQPAPATPIAPPVVTGDVQLNYENEDLVNVINQVASTLGLSPLIIDPEVKGTVNLNSGRISKNDVLPLFSLILKTNNAALIRQGGAYQIIPISAALRRGVELINQLPSSVSDIPQAGTDKPTSSKQQDSSGAARTAA
jgi:type II secretory pathway component GspD/PulD (secretin)